MAHFIGVTLQWDFARDHLCGYFIGKGRPHMFSRNNSMIMRSSSSSISSKKRATTDPSVGGSGPFPGGACDKLRSPDPLIPVSKETKSTLDTSLQVRSGRL